MSFIGPRTALLVPPIDQDSLKHRASVIAAGGTYSRARLQRNSRLIRALKAATVWSSLDRLWLFAAENATQAGTDLVSRTAVTPVNAPTFTANRGYAGNGTTSYIRTGFIPSSAGGRYALNSASLFAYVRTSRAAADMYAIAVIDGSNRAVVGPRGVADLTLFRANDTGGTVTVSQNHGFWQANRSASNARQGYLNGVSILSDATVSTGLPTLELWIGAQNDGGSGNNFSTDQIAFAGCGGGLSATQAAALYAAVQAYMTAVGSAV